MVSIYALSTLKFYIPSATRILPSPPSSSVLRRLNRPLPSLIQTQYYIRNCPVFTSIQCQSSFVCVSESRLTSLLPCLPGVSMHFQHGKVSRSSYRPQSCANGPPVGTACPCICLRDGWRTSGVLEGLSVRQMALHSRSQRSVPLQVIHPPLRI